LRGHDEKWGSPHNGNFMGLVELIAEFDPFLREHIVKCQSQQNKIPSYLSKTVYEEIIEIMGKRVLLQIVNDINGEDTKYYSVIADSTPDLAHTDQLAIIVPYCKKGKIYERFLSFLTIYSHAGISLFDTLKSFLEKIGLPIENCRGQSYDNAANMSGKYNGLQAHLKEANKFADYVPCAAHSLNLVGTEAVNIVPSITSYFGIVQQLYVFFSASTHRWDMLNQHANLPLSIKNLSQTRWSSHYEAIHALRMSYDKILDTLKNIFQNNLEKTDCQMEAKNLYNKLLKLEVAVLTVLWEEILERFNKTSKKLQTPGLDLCEGYALISSLELFVKAIRQDCNEKLIEYELKATKMSSNIEKNYSDQRNKTKKYSDGKKGKDTLTGRDKFRVEVVNILLDSLISELNKRGEVYEKLGKKFKFLIDIGNTTISDIDDESINFITAYYNIDIDQNLKSECIQFKEYIKLSKNLSEKKILGCPNILSLIYEENLIDIFPNLYTILKIYLTLPITSCEAERGFSKLSFIKNKYRSKMRDERLNYLSILSIENDITRTITYEEALKEYANAKCRKKLRV